MRTGRILYIGNDERGQMERQAFGAYLKELRIKAGKTLREFCTEGGFDPGNISKMERGLLPPPSSYEILSKYAQVLGVQKGTDDWYKLYDLASVGRGTIPEYVMSDEQLLASLPMVFRTLHNERLDQERLNRLITILKEN